MTRTQILSLIGLGALVVIILLCLAWCGQIKETEKVLAEKDAITEQALVAKNAAKAEYDQSQAEAAGRDVTEQNAKNINEAENANDDAGEAGRRGQLAYCERQRVRRQPLPSYCS